MSQFTDELQAFRDRLSKDGYPTHLLDKAISRMLDMEELILQFKEDLTEDDHEQKSK